MGYTTDFAGTFQVSPPLTEEHRLYLGRFADTRRMQRDPTIAATFPDPLRVAAGLPIGPQGAYYVGVPADVTTWEGHWGQDRDASVLAYNGAASGQPGLWCQWVPTRDGTGIMWDGSEKFYDYVQWLQYIVDHFLKPWGYSLSGEVVWEGENRNDLGTIVARDNTITTHHGSVSYGREEMLGQ